MSRLLSSIATRLRKEEFLIDESVPTGYLLSFALNRLFDYLRGLLLFMRPSSYCFVGRGVQIRCKSKIKFGRYVKFSDGSYIDAVSEKGVFLGENFSFGRGASIECTGSLKHLGVGLATGSNVGIGSFSFLGCAGGIVIDDDTIVGNFVSMHSENHGYELPEIPIRLQAVTRKGISIGKNCWIGAKVTILDGVKIGNNSIVAAGAVVVEGEYEDFSLLAGVPARKIKSLE